MLRPYLLRPQITVHFTNEECHFLVEIASEYMVLLEHKRDTIDLDNIS